MLIFGAAMWKTLGRLAERLKDCFPFSSSRFSVLQAESTVCIEINIYIQSGTFLWEQSPIVAAFSGQ